MYNFLKGNMDPSLPSVLDRGKEFSRLARLHSIVTTRMMSSIIKA